MYKSKRKITFNSKSHEEFKRVLLSRVHGYFDEKSMHQKANAKGWLQVSIAVVLFFVSWSLLVFQAHNFMISLIFLSTFIFASIAMSSIVAHNAIHGNLTVNPTLNKFIAALSYSLLGPNYYLWDVRHNVAHHRYVNVPGTDIDIEGVKFLRLAPHVQWLPIHRFQHYFSTIGFMIYTLHWIFVKDIMIFRMKSYGNLTEIKHSPWRLIEMITLKLFYFAFMLGVPSLYLPYSFGTIFLAFVVYHLVLSYIVMISFVGTHLNAETEFVHMNEKGEIPHNFYVHNLVTTIDFNVGNPLIDFLFGGLNSHIAHHMFPNVSSVHLPDLTKIIRKTAGEFQLPYVEKSIFGLWLSHYKFIRAMGHNPLSASPTLAQQEILN